MISHTSFVLVALALSRSALAQGTFNVLSMNVAGLPEILNGNGESGDKTENTKLIGQVCHSMQSLCFLILTLSDSISLNTLMILFMSKRFVASISSLICSSGLISFPRTSTTMPLCINMTNILIALPPVGEVRLLTLFKWSCLIDESPSPFWQWFKYALQVRLGGL
jgi:hypothetical protein